MRLSSSFYSMSLAIVLLVLIFHMLVLAHGGQVVTSNDLIVDSSRDSMKVGKRGRCGKERGDRKQEKVKGGGEERVFENEDYIYTQSLP
ncbi:hypothetical protein P3S67_018253 [Capsicum chacoense]